MTKKQQDEMAETYMDPAADPKDLEAAGEAVFEVQKEQEQDHERAWAEREAAGFAPRLIPGDTRFREEREAATREALGVGLPEPVVVGDDGKPRKLSVTGGEKVTVPTAAQAAERYNALRTPPGTRTSAETGSIMVNGVNYIYRLGEEVSLPPEVAEMVRHERAPIRTAQMLGGGGVPTVDLTRD